MRKVAGILMIIGAVPFAVIGFGALLNQPVPVVSAPREFVLVFVRALPSLLLLLFGILLGFGAYRLLKGRKENQ